MPLSVKQQDPASVAYVKDASKALGQISYQRFKEQISQFVDQRAFSMRQAFWFNDLKPTATVLEGSAAAHTLSGPHDFSSHFVPFIQKKIVPRGAKIIVLGDIHGDIAALLSTLEHLKVSGYLDDAYKICKDNVYLVFLGDYVNRGANSVPVISTLLDLVAKNPEQVVLLRGNHESAHTNSRFFARHNQPVADYAPVPFLVELADRFAGYCYPDLMLWYDYLPLGLYLGSYNDQGSIDYLNFCHGGIEIGHNPKNFLVSPESEFCMLSSLDRKTALTQLAQQDVTGKVADQITQALTYQGDERYAAYQALYQQNGTIDAASYQDQIGLRLGMLWNNFATQDNAELEFTLSPNRKTLYLGKGVTKYFLNAASSQGARLHGILRGHQHLDEEVSELDLKSAMLTRIRDGKGLVKQWQGMVYTLGASDNITGYHSFVMLTLNEQLQDWTVRHYFKKPDHERFSLHMTKMF